MVAYATKKTELHVAHVTDAAIVVIASDPVDV